MTLYSKLARKVIFPVGSKIYGSMILKHLNELQKSQWDGYENIIKLQNARLKNIIEVSYSRVSYYRKIMEINNLKPENILNSNDLVKMPTLDKETIRVNFPDNILAEDQDVNNLVYSASSGSTGEPLQFYRSKSVRDWEWASKFRSWEWGGFQLGDKYVTLMGNPTKVSKQSKNVNKLLNQVFIPAFDLNVGSIEGYVQFIIRSKPKMIRGYASALYYVANYLKENNPQKLKIIAAFPTGETLTPEYREIIEEGFGCPVYDTYGSEGNIQAFECPEHVGYHIAAEGVIAEFLGNDGQPVSPGERGEIVLTSLLNDATPFIRYKVGDFAVPSDKKCKCGRSLPLIEKLEGRMTDFFITQDGKLIVPYFFTRLFKGVPEITQFQVIQESMSNITVKIVSSEIDPAIFEIIGKTISEYIGDNTQVNFKIVDAIPIEKSGKKRFVISKVKRDRWQKFIETP